MSVTPPTNLPQMDTVYDSEIDRLLKMGGVNREQRAKHDVDTIPNQEHEKIVTPAHDLALELHHPIVEKSDPAWVRALRSSFVLYPLIFVGAFIFFYSVLNFQAIASQVTGWFAKPENEVVLGENLESYYNWIGGYYFSVGSADLLKPTNDIDKDGLSNHDEFILKTNPTIADSDGDGISDGIEAINSTNFWGEGRATEKQSKLLAELDLIMVNNRISFNVSANTNGAQVLGVEKINYDLNRNGKLSIPKLGIQIPLIWTKDPKDFDTDLTKGAVHYPGTALPGERGIVYVSAHSSDYPWKRHQFKQIFSNINTLENGDDIFVEIYGIDGKVYNYRYRVAEENIYKPDDQAQFIDQTKAKLNLSTCWPIGTVRDRYVVSAVLDSI